MVVSTVMIARSFFAPPIKEPCSKCSVGPTFDGSFGVDTEDIISVPCVDFGSFQFFPDQVQYYPGPLTKFHTNATVHGARWVKAHGDTAVAFGKPQTLLAAGIVTKDNWEDFVAFNSSKRMPPGKPCHGVDERQKDNAFVAWTAVVSSTCGKIGGMLEWMFFTNGLQDVPVVHRKREPMASSPRTGYSNGYTG